MVFCHCNPSRLIGLPSFCEHLCSVFLLRLLLWVFFSPSSYCMTCTLVYDLYSSVFFPLLFLAPALLEAKPSSSWVYRNLYSTHDAMAFLESTVPIMAHLLQCTSSGYHRPQKWCSEFLSSFLHDAFFNMLDVFSPLCPEKKLVFSSGHCTHHFLPCNEL